MSSELSLTWDEHRSTLVGVFERLLESSTLVDCTIAAEGQYLKAHKIILSACSPYFEMLFSQESEKNPIVVLKDIKFQELKALIDFIYRGKVKVPEERLGNFVDAAESLQIKGLGGGNQRRNNADLVETEYSLVDHNEEDLVSPRPRKRSRRSYANNNGDNVRGISPVIDLNAETKTDKELQSRETQLDVPISSEVEACTSLANLTEASTSFPSSECSEQQNLESKESISHVEEPTLQESEQVPNIENIVVKSEPEAIAEVFLPEIDCFIEPKGENIQDTMLDSAMRETEVVTGDNQPVSSQYSGFPSTLPSSSAPATVTTAGATVAGRSDNLLLMGDVGGSFTNPGAASFSDAAFFKQERVSTCSITASPSPTDSVCKITRSTADIPLPVAHPPYQRRLPRDGKVVKMSSSKYIFSCGICGKKFILRSYLRRHIRRHAVDRPFECHECGKTFKERPCLRVHLRTHTDERPFKCRDCGSAFRQLSTLQSHVRIHTDERPFQCQFCDSTFRQLSSLNSHVRTHTGEKPYKCDLCTYAATQIGGLKDHMWRIHGTMLSTQRK